MLSNPAAEAFSKEWERCFDRKPISANPIIADLDVEHNELAQTWKTFNRFLPPSSRVQRGDQAPDIDDLIVLIREVQTTWKSHPRKRVFDRPLALCDQLVPTLSIHDTLMTVLPDNRLFHTPLLYSVLQTVIKAASLYPPVIEIFLNALLEIHYGLKAPAEPLSASLHLFPVANIYARYFFFLTEFMDWFTRRSTCELLKSHSHDGYSEFHHLITAIQAQAAALAESADCMDVDEKVNTAYSAHALWVESQLSQIGREGTERRIAAQNTITRRLIWEIQQDAEERARIRQQKSQLLTEMLRNVNAQIRPVGDSDNRTLCMASAAPDVASAFEWFRVSRRRLARLELQSASKHLEAFFASDDQVPGIDPTAQLLVESKVVATLQTWATTPRSQALALGGSAGSFSGPAPNPVALISACYASAARHAQLPIVSHFCSLPADEKKGLTLQQQGLIALTYSLIRQLVNCLPTVVDSDSLLDVSAERFRQLDGTIHSWKAALSLVDTLLHFVPPLLVCVIDGIDMIHDSSTNDAIRDLIRILLTHTGHRLQPANSECSTPTFLFKILFTVTGRSSALEEVMSENHIPTSEPTQATEHAATEPVLSSDLGAVLMNA
ncbi:Uncharacterized protein PECH_002023 [Penicillium ucsense]|uniref:Uncharacterized protein n=1 Tax=Penicillium ucsense TaxID=2839758 RepID=A0A8J8W610_9EURO|nr:Uncharacterized protein PECM_004322 [Penicillium ucsense]KAF7731303.1 Uncharacterized protein PECH_002023 [Penicillium ucsense]